MRIGMFGEFMSVRAAKQSAALIERGHRTEFYTANDLWAGFSGYFDRSRGQVNITAWPELIRTSAFDVVIYYNMSNSPAVHLLQHKIPVVFDSGDMTSFFTGSADEEERFIFENASAIIHSSPGAMKYANSMFKIKCPQLALPNYVLMSEMLDPPDGPDHPSYSALGMGEVRGHIVYEGGFVPRSGGHRDYADIFLMFSRAGYLIDVYPSPTSTSTTQMMVINPLFKIHPPQAYNMMLEVLSRYDLGFIGFPRHANNRRQDFLDSVLPNKLFEYLAAGIPLLAFNSKTVEVLVRTHKIGYVLEEPTPDSLAAAFEQLTEYRANVIAKRHLFTMDHHVEELEELLTASLIRSSN